MRTHAPNGQATQHYSARGVHEIWQPYGVVKSVEKVEYPWETEVPNGKSLGPPYPFDWSCVQRPRPKSRRHRTVIVRVLKQIFSIKAE